MRGAEDAGKKVTLTCGAGVAVRGKGDARAGAGWGAGVGWWGQARGDAAAGAGRPGERAEEMGRRVGAGPGKEWRARDATGLSAWRESGARCLRREWERLCARAGPERVRRDAGWSWAELALRAEWR